MKAERPFIIFDGREQRIFEAPSSIHADQIPELTVWMERQKYRYIDAARPSPFMTDNRRDKFIARAQALQLGVTQLMQQAAEWGVEFDQATFEEAG